LHRPRRLRDNAPTMRTFTSILAVAACLFGAVVLQACSSQQIYGAGQAWQHLECSKINDTQERNRCMASASTSYEEYRRQAEAAKGAR
jgi:hypothetical protein